MPGDQPDTIIGVNVELKGSLHNHGSIHIHGKVVGDIFSDSIVIIGETAVVTGPIVAKQVDVSGQVHGSISAETQIELQAKSLVKGDLTTNRLSIKPGATFIGKSQMNMSEEGAAPQDGESAEKKKPRLEIE